MFTTALRHQAFRSHHEGLAPYRTLAYRSGEVLQVNTVMGWRRMRRDFGTAAHSFDRGTMRLVVLSIVVRAFRP
jgi:hypothetical protein